MIALRELKLYHSHAYHRSHPLLPQAKADPSQQLLKVRMVRSQALKTPILPQHQAKDSPPSSHRQRWVILQLCQALLYKALKPQLPINNSPLQTRYSRRESQKEATINH